LPRPLLEDLAKSTVETDTFQFITKLFDQYINFISLEDNLFILNQHKSYLTFNHPTITDAEAESHIEKTAEGLFSIFVTLGQIPVIRSNKNGAAEAIAQKLNEMIVRHRQDNPKENLFSASGASGYQRPLLIILERNVDLSVMLQHCWTYQPLVHDLLDLNLNKIHVDIGATEKERTEEQKKKDAKVFDLDSSIDTFLEQNSGIAFPNIAGAVSALLKEYQTAMDELTKLAGGQSLETLEDQEKLLGKTKALGTPFIII
jgi:hypothetical protein